MDHPSSSSGPSGCWKCQSLLCSKISSRAEVVVGRVNLSWSGFFLISIPCSPGSHWKHRSCDPAPAPAGSCPSEGASAMGKVTAASSHRDWGCRGEKDLGWVRFMGEF